MLDLAAQSYSSKFFANDSRPGGYLKAPSFIANEKKQQAVSSWMAAHSRGNAHRMAMLDGGIMWEKVGVNPEEAQFLQTRVLNAKQIGVIFGVPFHFLGGSEESRANMEQRSIEFLTFTIRPWLAKWEQGLNMKLFPTLGRNAGRYFCKFDTTLFERATYTCQVVLRGLRAAQARKCRASTIQALKFEIWMKLGGVCAKKHNLRFSHCRHHFARSVQ